jgi:RIO kinase 1
MRSKKKRSSREDFMLKEKTYIEEGVFDIKTMMKLRKFFTKEIIERLDFLIGRGKEADVYVAEGGKALEGKLVVIKIFRIETSNFRSRMNYMIGDPRFSHIKKNILSIVNEWCKKEYGNLNIAFSAGVHAPKPYYFSGNILAMEIIEDKGAPAPQLKNIKINNPEHFLDIIIKDMKKLYANNLVHADISEYNILVKENTPYIIDFGQAVVLLHPNAKDFLRRDINTILNYFLRTYNISKNSDDVFSYITNQ